jgi:hypothetical protein
VTGVVVRLSDTKSDAASSNLASGVKHFEVELLGDKDFPPLAVDAMLKIRNEEFAVRGCGTPDVLVNVGRYETKRGQSSVSLPLPILPLAQSRVMSLQLTFEHLEIAGSHRFHFLVHLNKLLEECLKNYDPSKELPMPPWDLRAHSVNQNSIELIWYACDYAWDRAEHILEIKDGMDWRPVPEEKTDSDYVSRRGPRDGGYVAAVSANLHPATQYTYRVRAQNKAGSTFSQAPSEVTIKTQDTLPIAPIILNAIPDKRAIRLRWLDRSLNESGFRIYRREAGHYAQDVAAEFPAYQGTDEHTWTDETVRPDVLYSYVVAAYNDVGTCPSNEVSAKVPPEAEVPKLGCLEISYRYDHYVGQFLGATFCQAQINFQTDVTNNETDRVVFSSVITMQNPSEEFVSQTIKHCKYLSELPLESGDYTIQMREVMSGVAVGFPYSCQFQIYDGRWSPVFFQKGHYTGSCGGFPADIA